MKDHEIVKGYNIPAFEYLRRAKEQIEMFDQGNLPSLFYAALELRIGIEMRLNDYIKAADKNKSQTKKYSGKELKRELHNIDPETDQECIVTFSLGGNVKKASSMKFTPVSEKLANEMYGKLGNLLHRKFADYKYWYRYKWWREQRELLEEVVKELEYTCSGSLRNVPKFRPYKDA